MMYDTGRIQCILIKSGLVKTGAKITENGQNATVESGNPQPHGLSKRDGSVDVEGRYAWPVGKSWGKGKHDVGLGQIKLRESLSCEWFVSLPHASGTKTTND